MALPAVERRNFKIGKYDIVAQPAFGSAHMPFSSICLRR